LFAIGDCGLKATAKIIAALRGILIEKYEDQHVPELAVE
jgi:hypothetical protein